MTISNVSDFHIDTYPLAGETTIIESPERKVEGEIEKERTN